MTLPLVPDAEVEADIVVGRTPSAESRSYVDLPPVPDAAFDELRWVVNFATHVMRADI